MWYPIFVLEFHGNTAADNRIDTPEAPRSSKPSSGASPTFRDLDPYEELYNYGNTEPLTDCSYTERDLDSSALDRELQKRLFYDENTSYSKESYFSFTPKDTHQDSYV